MDVYLIRHSAVAVEKGICYGRSDVDLKESCGLEFELVKKKVKGITADQVFSSPAVRCTQLAHYLAGSSKVIPDERLWELNFGEWELKAWNELPGEQLRNWTENYITGAPPAGESYSALFTRTKEFWEENIATSDKPVIFIITHGGIIRSILSYILEIPLHKSFSLQVDLCSVSKVVLAGGFSSIGFVNR